jgi:hypothetical protein
MFSTVPVDQDQESSRQLFLTFPVGSSNFELMFNILKQFMQKSTPVNIVDQPFIAKWTN